MVDRIVRSQTGPDAGREGGDEAAAPSAPWDLPPRRTHQPGWSAPPPWASNAKGGAPAGDSETPAFLRPPAAGEERVWGRRPTEADEGDVRVPPPAAVPRGLGQEDEAAAERDATRARLRALGMDDHDNEDEVDQGAGPRPVAGVTRAVDPTTGKAVGAGRPSRADALAASAAAGDAAADEYAGGEAPVRQSSGLSRLLGWDRRPRAGATRPPRRTEREPAWERPRRFEAYPTLRTRVGMPTPSRAVLAAGALLLAALVLFFVPPLFLSKGGGQAPGASGSPDSSGVGSSARPSVAPTRIPSPTPKTYTVRSGDTLSTIAKRFGLTVEEILAANKNIKNPNKIAIGDLIVIPSAAPSEVLDGGASSSP